MKTSFSHTWEPALNQRDPQPTLQIAIQLHQQGRLHEALAIYRTLVDNGADAATFYLMGNCLAQAGQYGEAISELTKALRLDNTLEDAYVNLAICQEECGQTQEALKTLERALPLFPTNKRLRNRYGRMLLDSGDAHAAVLHFRNAIETDHEFIPAYLNLAQAHETLDNIDDGIAVLKSALNRAPDDAMVRNNLANLLRQKGDYDEAHHLLQVNIEQCLLLSESYHNLAQLEQDKGHADIAHRYYQQSLQTDPDNLLSQWNASLLELRQGHWHDALNRYNIGKRIGARPELPSSLRQWQGEELNGKKLLIWHEQGLGEEILFASVYHLLPGEAAQIMAVCSPRLKNLFNASIPQIAFVEKNEITDASFPYFEFHVLAGDLPWLLGITPYGKLHAAGFLKPATSNIKLTLAKSSKKRIGLSWRGGKNQQERQKRSLAIQDLAELLKDDEYVFVNLQYDATKEELSFLRSHAQHIEVHPELDIKNDFDTLAKLVCSLNAIVCCTNTIGHLAGALNVPTYMLTPVSPTWYWLATETSSPWYASLQLVRQKKAGTWSREIDNLIDLIKKNVT